MLSMIYDYFIYDLLYIIGVVGRVLANRSGDRSSIPGRVIPKTQKMVLDASLLNIQHYKVRIKGKLGNPGKAVALGLVVIEKGAIGSPSTTAAKCFNIFYAMLYMLYHMRCYCILHILMM